MMRRLTAILAVVVLAAPPARAGSYTFTDITNPKTGDTGGSATGINDSGQVSGLTFPSGFSTYIRNADGTFTFPTPPGLSTPVAQAISNNGYVVFQDNSNPFPDVIEKPDGTFSNPITSINGVPGGNFSLNGINSSGEAVGFLSPGNNKEGMIYNTTTGVATLFPNTVQQDLLFNGVNDSGTIVGQVLDASGNGHGLIMTAAGVTTTFDVPIAGATNTEAMGIDGNGDIVGTYQGSDNRIHGFIRAADGTITTVDNPEAVAANGNTFLTGINDSGEIVGSWTQPNGGIGTGFFATSAAVPEPASFVMLGLGIGGIAAVRVARRRRLAAA